MHTRETINDRIANVRNHASRVFSILSERDAPHFETDDLYQLGIHAVKVDLDEEGILGFEPCFFLPQFSKTLLTDYPLRADSLDNRWRGGPNYEEFDFQYFCELRDFEDLDFWQHAGWLSDFVERHLEAVRDGLPHELLSLDETVPIDYSYDPRDYQIFSRLGTTTWEMYPHPVNSTSSHSIVSIHNCSRAEDTCLSRGEVLGVLNILKDNFKLESSPSEDTKPCLLMSYFGEKKGRIIQAHHDGQKLVLQYSPLVNFCDTEATVSLFLRYMTSYLIASSTSTLVVR
ncbi:hypothetical protein C8Q69DRAFT_530598 [Paecilomyces variotii]|uniref:Uncharacterized protein n=1 Tax=Byssochlamys spectabilis TaxID=264951 RepID=A0A443HKR8_BYSSP|nr:hypothetical protein C8Q69DRAFT_530598 [Paecilomyces variotii]KAJ9355343.1 hypothetical protein DTO280E4_6558 [Paecilomyces variotii]RWQ92399.1 hypothetical protein C8Q69DRAFT_530598 [Paecilomyces variotii]